MIGPLLFSALIGFIVGLIGTAFDKTPNNRNAWLAGLIVFVVLFLVTVTNVENL